MLYTLTWRNGPAKCVEFQLKVNHEYNEYLVNEKLMYAVGLCKISYMWKLISV